MSSSTCPTTCGLLSTAAIFISVGIVQLLAGIILIKSEYVYLLSGTDFIASFSNIIVGCLLGMSASSWESKLKRISIKNESRRNVLAGLYISVVAVNATTAIIMILGDGNNLLTALAVATSPNAKFVGEILTCAYVMSVCSPIVCIVVAIVCLSGNRLELIEDLTKIRKKKNKSISKSESYSWVFKNPPNQRNDSLPQSLSRTSSSGDCVFIDTPMLNSSVKNTATSITKDQKSLKIWAERRKKILQEITAPRCSVFSDNYLQFPEFDYSSYMETLLPRIKHTSLVRSKTASTSSIQSETQSNSVSNNSVRFSGESITKRLTPAKCRRATINRSNLTKNVNADAFKQYIETKSASTNSCCRETLDADKHKVRHECQDKLILECNQDQNMSTTPSKDSQQKLYKPQNVDNCYNDTLNNIDDERENKQVDCANKIENTIDKLTNRDTHSVSFDFAPETLENKMETNLTVNPLNQNSINQLKSRLMKSFKHVGNEEHKLDWNNQNYVRKYSLTEDIPLDDSHSSVNLNTPIAGKMVPITIRNTFNRTNSIPVSSDKLRTSTSKSLNCELKNDAMTLYSSIQLNDVQISTKVKHATLKRKDAIKQELSNQELGPMTQLEEKEEKLQNISDTAESTESVHNLDERCSNRKVNTLDFVQDESSSETTNESVNTETFPVAPGSQSMKNRGKKQPAIRFPSIFIGCPSGPDGQTDISNFIMDGDSLLGLSDEELLDRTKRIRQLRKSVEIRSKEKKNEHP